ncbi:hypothetical protein RB5781 [Rhodopirellula baltica SH 1]|uniref:Uncharacterized protein n=2 Tax=Rhodopirellula baltica TaxID=265606 RepID=Q7URA7_RHOBA|nr:hypothetical protein [Rhodopirellula baltica]CAD74433.1 hypothetical protein RB5781 [Rhodopirellula baltica SH 1]
MTGRGLQYTLGILWCRVVPAWCFRYRCMEIVRLGPSSAEGESNDRNATDAYQARKVVSAEELEHVQMATLYSGDSSPQWSTQSKDVAANEPTETAYAVFRMRSTERSSQSENQNESAAQIVGGVWIATRSFTERDLHLQIDLAEHQRWLFAARMIPEERNRGAYSVLLRKLLWAETSSDPSNGRGAEAGEVTQVWAAINPANHRSVRAHAVFNNSSAGRIHMVRVGPLAVAWRGRSSADIAMTMRPKWTWRGGDSPLRMTVEPITSQKDSTANSD